MMIDLNMIGNKGDLNSDDVITLSNNKTLVIATGSSRQAKRWRNRSLNLSEFVTLCASPARTAETFEAYLAMGKPEQDEIKDVGGFVGGSLKGGRRRKADVANRSVITLDMDYCNAKTPDKIKKVLKNVCHTVYSTHKHQPGRPRLRLIIYPDRVLLPDEYQAVGRAIAEKTGIDCFDDTTYDVNRLMYWPSCSSDAEFVFWHNDEKFLNIDKVLSWYGDDESWKDATLWPVSSRETKVMTRLLKKQADPLKKKGIVGSFCRIVSIHQALGEVLSDVYKKERKDRYTYRDGSTTNGVVIYDNKYCYSNHSTDPAMGQLCNSFDIIRIHKFGQLDSKKDIENKSATLLPSFKAMNEFAKEFEGVKADLVSSGLVEITADDFDDLSNGNRDVDGEVEPWREGLQITDKGAVKPTFFNATLILRNDTAINKTMRFNDFSGQMEKAKVIDNGNEDGSEGHGVEWAGEWKSEDSFKIRRYVGLKYNVDFPENKIEQAIENQGFVLRYHPVRDYLEGLKWDGKKRVDTLFIDYFGCEDNLYSREVARCWITAAVYRVFNPGYKFDNAVVLSGPQGIGKTTFIRLLGLNKWYGELSSFDPKIAVEEITGKWLIEISELGATNKQALEQQKAFLSAQSTRVRMAYARRALDFKRQCVFIGSTNADEYLKDSTGNRRWWPIDCSDQRIDYKRLNSEVDQIWAEGYSLWVQSAPTILSAEAEQIAIRMQADKLESDPYQGIIEEWLEEDADYYRYDLPGEEMIGFESDKTERRDMVCIIEIWEDCLKEKVRPRPADRRRIAGILNRIPGWTKKGAMRFGKRFGVQKGWARGWKSSPKQQENTPEF